MLDRCEEFRERLNQAIDQRLDPAGDRQVRRHAARCDSCACELNAWTQIQSLYPEHADWDGGNERKRISWSILAFVAAAIGFAAVGTYFSVQERPGELVSLPSAESRPLPVQEWFNEVQRQSWIDQTMPVVRNVGKGVAPLGRSLQQAVSILTPGGRDTTS